MNDPSIVQRRRGLASQFKEDGRSKLSVKFNDDEMNWINTRAKDEDASLAEIVRRSVRERMRGKK